MFSTYDDSHMTRSLLCPLHFSALLYKLMASAANPRGFYLIVSACQWLKDSLQGQA